MARKASAAVVESHEITADQTPGLDRAMRTINEGVVLDAQIEATVRAVAAQIGYQLPADCTNPDLIQRDISANLRRSVEACIEVGRGLAVLKTACGHGNFMARLDVLGIDVYVASKFIGAGKKFSNLRSNANLKKALGNQTKLFEMLVLDDEQLEELELTGQTGELHLDEIATMSVKELRAALRDRTADLEASRKRVSVKEAEAEALTKKLRRAEKAKPDEVGKELRELAAVEAFAAEAAITGNLRNVVNSLSLHGREHNQSHEDFIAGLLCQIEAAVSGLRGEFQLKAKPDGDDMPEWMRPGFDAKAAANGQSQAN